MMVPPAQHRTLLAKLQASLPAGLVAVIGILLFRILARLHTRERARVKAHAAASGEKAPERVTREVEKIGTRDPARTMKRPGTPGNGGSPGAEIGAGRHRWIV